MADRDPATQRTAREQIPWLFRRGWVVLACVVIAIGAAGVASRTRPVTYSASATLLVSSGATPANPGSNNEAASLASTYSALIPNDSAILRVVARATGLLPSQVTSDTTVTVVNGTSLLNIRFVAGSPRTALRGVDSMSAAVSGLHPVTKAIQPLLLTPTQRPTSATRHHTSRLVIVGLSVLFGLLLGIVLMIIWERADARFDKPEQLANELGIPSRSMSDLGDASVLAIMREWRSLALRRMGALEGHAPRVALVPATGSARVSTPKLAQSLVASASTGSLRVGASIADAHAEEVAPRHPHLSRSEPETGSERSRNGYAPSGQFIPVPISSVHDLELLVGNVPGLWGGEAVSQQAHVTVLVVPAGSRVREVRRSVSLLTELGALPVWALMPTRTHTGPASLSYAANESAAPMVEVAQRRQPKRQPS